MRCNNCGWDEPNPNVTTCVKCGHQLQEQPAPAYGAQRNNGYNEKEVIKQTRVFNGLPQQQAEPSLKQTVIQSAPANGQPAYAAQQPFAAQPKQTVIQRVDFDNRQQPQPQEQQAQPSETCPRCGYLWVGEYCANCGYDGRTARTPEPKEQEKPRQEQKQERISRQEVERLLPDNECSKCGEKVPHDFRFCPKCGEPIVVKTINPFANRKAAAPEPEPQKPQCKLTLIVDEGEEGKEALVHQFEGESVVLKRDNTDPYNPTITSKEQAELTFADGHWHIENRSEYDSTQVVANRKLQLNDGDIIVLGDRRFRFEAPETKE